MGILFSKGGKRPIMSRGGSKGVWYEDDTVVNLVPKFKIKDGEMMKEKFMALVPDFFDLVKTNEQDTCVHYGFVSRIRVFHITCITHPVLYPHQCFNYALSIQT